MVMLLQEAKLLKDFSQRRKITKITSSNVLVEAESNIITISINASYMVIVKVSAELIIKLHNNWFQKL